MTRKFALAALAIAALTAGPMLATDAQARDGRRGNALAIGIAAGVGGLLIGSAIANAQPRRQVIHHYQPQPQSGHYGQVSFGGGYRYQAERECFRKPIERIDRFTGEIVTVGFKTLCR
jgi:hypothetical protein